MDECFSEDSHAFIQVACVIPNYEVRQVISLGIACAVTFVALFVLNFIDYISRMQEIRYIEWDVKTLTSSDYTVEVDIGNDFYSNYKRLEE